MVGGSVVGEAVAVTGTRPTDLKVGLVFSVSCSTVDTRSSEEETTLLG